MTSNISRNTSYTRTVNIPEYIYQKAEERAENQVIFKRSYREDEANGVGCLGEVIAECWMDKNFIEYEAELECTTHDYRVNGKTIDVKTKDRTVKPRRNYDNTAPCYNHEHQKPDYFLFITLERSKDRDDKDLRRFHTANIVGGISYDELNRVGIKFLKGEKDWRNGTKFWTDCLNVEMWQLIPLNELIKIFKGELSSPTEDAELNIPIIKEMRRRINIGKLKDRQLPLGM
ncbi:hypothetical protein [Vibrio harveyi]|uniref:hypothetical protein n=1 Tax=Vibrio harveyi TaxID=669 RepID=UPI003CF34748